MAKALRPTLPILFWIAGSVGLAALLSACSDSIEQPTAGDGWRMLASELPNEPLVYNPSQTLFVARDRQGVSSKWREVGLAGSPPPVDFKSELVVMIEGFSNDDCPDVIFDGFVEEESQVVDLLISTTPDSACRSFGTTHVVFVALEYDELPPPPFVIRQGSGGLAALASVT